MSAQSTQRITKREQLAILASSAVAALSTFVATWIANFTLPAQQVTEFLLFWAALFGVFGVVAGVSSEATRAVGAAKLAAAPANNDIVNSDTVKATEGSKLPGADYIPAKRHLKNASVTLTAGAIGGAVAILLTLSSPAWLSQIANTSPQATLILLAFGVLLYAVHAALSGAAAGNNSWLLYAFFGGAEALFRLLAMALVAFTTGALISLEAAVVSPVLMWVVLVILNKNTRHILLLRADVSYPKLFSNMFFALLSSAASAVLMTGFPLILRFSEAGESTSHNFLVLGALILAVSICRSPIMIPLQAFQGVAIASFLKQRHRPLAAFTRPALLLLAFGTAGGVLAALLGPWMFLLIYPPKAAAVSAYAEVAQSLILGALTLASAVMALLVLSGTAVLALNGHFFYAAGWILAACVTTALVFILPLPLIARTIIALFLGPASGCCLHLYGMLRLRDNPVTDRL